MCYYLFIGWLCATTDLFVGYVLLFIYLMVMCYYLFICWLCATVDLFAGDALLLIIC